MTTRTFKLKTHSSGRLRTVNCVIYEDLKQLQRGATKFRSDADFSNALGVSQPRFGYLVDDDGNETELPDAGYIRLFRERMGGAIVAHEMLHMALAIYREDWYPDHGTPDDDIENEEVLCHLMSDLVADSTRKFWKAGIYTA